MAKKSLTDLLREEVQKSPELESELEGENIQDTTAVEELQMNTPSKARTRTSSTTKAELETTVAELKAALKKAEKAAQDKEEIFTDLKKALEESHENEGSLQQQINELQSELQQQKQFVEKLQNAQKQLEQIKTEFEKAKKAAVQLAEVNEKLAQEMDTLKKQKEFPKTQANNEPEHKPGRPIQQDRDKSEDFAKKAWLL